MNLLDAWFQTARQFPDCKEITFEVFAAIKDAYSEPHRRYHTFDHLKACMTVLEREFPALNAYDHDRVVLGLFFHDFVYSTQGHDNEVESAKAFRRLMPSIHDPIEYLILATRHGVEIPKTRQAQVLVDVDLSILGEDEDTFDQYERQVREEYSWVPEDVFRAGRAKILEGFLDQEWIYNTPEMRKAREGEARANLKRSIARLQA